MWLHLPYSLSGQINKLSIANWSQGLCAPQPPVDTTGWEIPAPFLERKNWLDLMISRKWAILITCWSKFSSTSEIEITLSLDSKRTQHISTPMLTKLLEFVIIKETNRQFRGTIVWWFICNKQILLLCVSYFSNFVLKNNIFRHPRKQIIPEKVQIDEVANNCWRDILASFTNDCSFQFIHVTATKRYFPPHPLSSSPLPHTVLNKITFCTPGKLLAPFKYDTSGRSSAQLFTNNNHHPNVWIKRRGNKRWDERKS